MRIFTVISFLVLTYDLRSICEPVEFTNTRDQSDGNRMQDDSSDGVETGRNSRGVGSALVNIYPAQVDLTEWTRKLEEKFEDFAKLVDFRFKALDSLVKGLEEKFHTMDHRQNETEKLTATRFKEVKERIDQFESRLNDSRTQTEARLEELETRINDLCQRPTESPNSSSSFRPTAKPLVSTVTTPPGQRAACMELQVESTNLDNKRYEEFGGKCYLFYANSVLQWMSDGESARQYCQRFGADLVAVETSEENEFIKRVINSSDYKRVINHIGQTDEPWNLGGKRIGNDYIWVQTGNRFGFTDWGTGYPDRDPYVYLSSEYSVWYTGNSYDSSNSICEA